MKTPLTNIKPNTINSEIYSQTDLSDLKQSLQTNGQLEPIVVNSNNEIISGHRRYYSMVQLGWEDCEIRIVNYENDTIALIEHNKQRIKSVNDIVNEARYLEKELKEKFGGKGKRNDLNGNGRFVVVEQLADKLGLGLSKMKQIKTISNYEPDLIQKIDNGELSVNGAYKIVKKKHFNSSSNPKQNDFDRKFRRLLNEYQPTKEEIIKVLQSTHPYSLEDFGTMVETNHTLKKKELN